MCVIEGAAPTFIDAYLTDKHNSTGEGCVCTLLTLKFGALVTKAELLLTVTVDFSALSPFLTIELWALASCGNIATNIASKNDF